MAWNPSLTKLPYLVGQAKNIGISLLLLWEIAHPSVRSVFPLK